MLASSQPSFRLQHRAPCSPCYRTSQTQALQAARTGVQACTHLCTKGSDAHLSRCGAATDAHVPGCAVNFMGGHVRMCYFCMRSCVQACCLWLGEVRTSSWVRLKAVVAKLRSYQGRAQAAWVRAGMCRLGWGHSAAALNPCALPCRRSNHGPQFFCCCVNTNAACVLLCQHKCSWPKCRPPCRKRRWHPGSSPQAGRPWGPWSRLRGTLMW